MPEPFAATTRCAPTKRSVGRTRCAARLLALAASALLIAGCGMRGPLYLPEPPAPEQQRPTELQAPRSIAPSPSHARLS